MPELPDITVYVGALQDRILGQSLESVRLASPFLLRTFEPPIEDLVGRAVCEVRRVGKRIVLGFDGEHLLAIHLMITGRLRWGRVGARPPGKVGLAALGFPRGTLLITEAGSKKRAAIHVLRGRDALEKLDPGGLEVLGASLRQFAAALRCENHTLKRALTDPRLFSGIGNAYSDEILHAAGLSPMTLTSKLADEEMTRLFEAARATLTRWIDKLRHEFGRRFPGPGEVTAFRPEFAVHGRYGQPCPACGTTVQRIRYAENETNYCPRCQTGGRVLADRSLSRLLKHDWPRSIEDLER